MHVISLVWCDIDVCDFLLVCIAYSPCMLLLCIMFVLPCSLPRRLSNPYPLNLVVWASLLSLHCLGSTLTPCTTSPCGRETRSVASLDFLTLNMSSPVVVSSLAGWMVFSLPPLALSRHPILPSQAGVPPRSPCVHTLPLLTLRVPSGLAGQLNAGGNFPGGGACGRVALTVVCVCVFS